MGHVWQSTFVYTHVHSAVLIRLLINKLHNNELLRGEAIQWLVIEACELIALGPVCLSLAGSVCVACLEITSCILDYWI